MKQKLFPVALLLSMASGVYGQLGDLARVDYTLLPASADFEFNRTRFLFNYPIKLNKNRSYLFLGLDYSNINISYGDVPRPFDIEELDGFQLLDLNIGYTAALRNNWRLGVRVTPGISSNLEADDLTFADVVFSSDVVFIKDKRDLNSTKRPFRLIIGVSYSQNRGFPFPLPFISYYRKLSPYWSFNIGVPKSNLQFHFSKRNRLKVFAQLDGFTAHIQKGVDLEAGFSERINMSLILGGLQYEYHFSEHLELYAQPSFIIDRSVYLRDTRNNDILLLDDSHGLSMRVGVKFKI